MKIEYIDEAENLCFFETGDIRSCLKKRQFPAGRDLCLIQQVLDKLEREGQDLSWKKKSEIARTLATYVKPDSYLVHVRRMNNGRILLLLATGVIVWLVMLMVALAFSMVGLALVAAPILLAFVIAPVFLAVMAIILPPRIYEIIGLVTTEKFTLTPAVVEELGTSLQMFVSERSDTMQAAAVTQLHYDSTEKFQLTPRVVEDLSTSLQMFFSERSDTMQAATVTQLQHDFTEKCQLIPTVAQDLGKSLNMREERADFCKLYGSVSFSAASNSILFPTKNIDPQAIQSDELLRNNDGQTPSRVLRGN